MAYRFGHARVNARAPEPAGVCDRCSMIYSLADLAFQYDFTGAGLINKRILVCRTCMDVPQPQLLSRILPADPVPIMNPRPFDWVAAEEDLRVTSGLDSVDFWTGIPVPAGDTRITQNNRQRVVQQTGERGLNQRPGTDPNAPGNDDPGLPYNNTDVPETGPLFGEEE